MHGEYEESKLHVLLVRIFNALATVEVRIQILQKESQIMILTTICPNYTTHGNLPKQLKV